MSLPQKSKVMHIARTLTGSTT
ncbi:hypothetical protein RPL81_32370, partial [Salmonella enterica]|nr:hypothetical protein [Salmonella enterica]